MGGPALRGLVVVGLLVALAAATGTAAADTAVQSSNVTAERVDAGSVEVRVTADWFDASAENATANVTVPAAGTSTDVAAATGASDDSTYVFRAPVSTLSVAGRDLSEATLTVTALSESGNLGQSGNATADLRRLTVSGDGATLDAETRTLRLNATRALGVPDGGSVPVTLAQGGSTAGTSGTLRLTDGGARLRVDDLSALDPFGQQVTVTPYPDTDHVGGANATVTLTDAAETVLQWREGGVVLANALFRDQTFVLDVETTGPDGRYVAERGARGGYVPLPDNVTRAASLTVTVRYDGEAVLSGVSPGTTATGTTATVDGRNVTFGTSLPADLQSVWVADGGLHQYRNVSASGQTLTFEGANPVAAGQNLLVVGADDVLRASVTQGDGATAGQNGSANRSGGIGGLGGGQLFEPPRWLSLVTGLLFATGILIGLVAGLAGERLDPTLMFLVSLVAVLAWVSVVLLAAGFDWLGWPDGVAGMVGTMAGVVVTIIWTSRTDETGGRTGTRTGGAGATRSQNQTRSVTVRVVDGLDGSLLQEQVDVRIQPQNQGPKIRSVTGEREFELGPTKHTFNITGGANGHTANGSIDPVKGQHGTGSTLGGTGGRASQRGPPQGRTGTTTEPDDQTVTLELSPHDVTVKVTDEDTGRPVGGASVTFTAEDYGLSESGRTDQSGVCSQRVSVQVDTVSVSVEADRYESAAKSVSPTAASPTVRVPLTPKTGRAEAAVALDGDPVPGLPVRFEPLEDGPAESRTVETGTDGTATVEGLRVGRYELRAALPTGANAFSVSTESVRVRDGATASERLDVSFAYSLGTAQRDRMAELDERLDSLSSVARRDTAVPYFYASAVRELLGVAESVPDEGLALLQAETDPDAVVTAVLDAAELATGAVEDAMTSKRNVDLFTACSDLPDVTVEYDGTVALANVLELAAHGSSPAQLDRVDERLRTVDDRITSERGDLSEVSPARQMWEATRDLIREDRPSDPLASAALLVAAETLLDAIEVLFEDAALRERMSRTVF